MTQEEKDALLKEAKRRYPVGTEYNCACDGHVNTAERDPEIIDPEDGDIDVGVGYVRYNGKWATIVSTPQPQLKVGSWYRCSAWINTSSIRRFKGISDDGRFSYTEWLQDGRIYDRHREVHMTDSDHQNWKTFTEVPLSEIQQYLPDGHVDKLVAAKDEEWEPKVGDWGVVLSNKSNGCHVIGKSYKITGEGYAPHWELTGIDQEGRYDSWYYDTEEIRKALPHEIPGNEQQKKEEHIEEAAKKIESITEKLRFWGGVDDGPCKFEVEPEPEIKPIPTLKEDLYIPSKTILF